MSANEATEVPLIEQLRSIPADYRTSREIQWASDGTPTGHQFIPVGHMMHRAADELSALRNQLAERERAIAGMADNDRRYKWLRDQSLGQFEHPIAVSQERTERGMRYVGPLMGRELDAAIDSAPPKVQQGEGA